MTANLKEAFQGVAVEYGDIRMEEIERSQVVFRGKELEEVTRNSEVGGCVRVFDRGNWGVSTFNSLEGSLGSLVHDTVAQVKLLTPKAGKGVLPLSAANQQVRLNPDLDPRQIPLEQKHDLIRRYNDILLREPKIATTSAVYADQHIRSDFYSTEGRSLAQEKVYTGVSLAAIARDGTNVQSYGKTFGKTQGFDTLIGLESEIETIARTTLDLLNAEKVAAGTYTVVIDPLLAGVFAHEAFGHLSEADFMYQNEHLREMMRIGARYGIDELSIVDDGSMPGERGSFAFDDEGAPAGKNYLILGGKVHSHLHSRQTAHEMDEHLTGNARAINYRFAPIVRMTNTYIEPRKATLEQMIGDIREGLYVVGARGGMTELESFTFSSQYAYEIKNGKRGKMIRDVVLSGNIFETLKNIDAIGNDLKLYGGLGGCGKAGQSPLPTGTGGPHVRIRNVTIGGK
jgi:TldD protein